MIRGSRPLISRRGLLLSALGATALLLAIPSAQADPDASLAGEGSGRPAGAPDSTTPQRLPGQPSRCTRAGRHVTAFKDPERNTKVSRAGQPRARKLGSKVCDPNGDRKPFDGTTVDRLTDS